MPSELLTLNDHKRILVPLGIGAVGLAAGMYGYRQYSRSRSRDAHNHNIINIDENNEEILKSEEELKKAIEDVIKQKELLGLSPRRQQRKSRLTQRVSNFDRECGTTTLPLTDETPATSQLNHSLASTIQQSTSSHEEEENNNNNQDLNVNQSNHEHGYDNNNLMTYGKNIVSQAANNVSRVACLTANITSHFLKSAEKEGEKQLKKPVECQSTREANADELENKLNENVEEGFTNEAEAFAEQNAEVERWQRWNQFDKKQLDDKLRLFRELGFHKMKRRVISASTSTSTGEESETAQAGAVRGMSLGSSTVETSTSAMLSEAMESSNVSSDGSTCTNTTVKGMKRSRYAKSSKVSAKVKSILAKPTKLIHKELVAESELGAVTDSIGESSEMTLSQTESTITVNSVTNRSSAVWAPQKHSTKSSNQFPAASKASRKKSTFDKMSSVSHARTDDKSTIVSVPDSLFSLWAKDVLAKKMHKNKSDHTKHIAGDGSSEILCTEYRKMIQEYKRMKKQADHRKGRAESSATRTSRYTDSDTEATSELISLCTMSDSVANESESGVVKPYGDWKSKQRRYETLIDERVSVKRVPVEKLTEPLRTKSKPMNSPVQAVRKLEVRNAQTSVDESFKMRQTKLEENKNMTQQNDNKRELTCANNVKPMRVTEVVEFTGKAQASSVPTRSSQQPTMNLKPDVTPETYCRRFRIKHKNRPKITIGSNEKDPITKVEINPPSMDSLDLDLFNQFESQIEPGFQNLRASVVRTENGSVSAHKAESEKQTEFSDFVELSAERPVDHNKLLPEAETNHVTEDYQEKEAANDFYEMTGHNTEIHSQHSDPENDVNMHPCDVSSSSSSNSSQQDSSMSSLGSIQEMISTGVSTLFSRMNEKLQSIHLMKQIRNTQEGIVQMSKKVSEGFSISRSSHDSDSGYDTTETFHDILDDSDNESFGSVTLSAAQSFMSIPDEIPSSDFELNTPNDNERTVLKGCSSNKSSHYSFGSSLKADLQRLSDQIETKRHGYYKICPSLSPSIAETSDHSVCSEKEPAASRPSAADNLSDEGIDISLEDIEDKINEKVGNMFHNVVKNGSARNQIRASMLSRDDETTKDKAVEAKVIVDNLKSEPEKDRGDGTSKAYQNLKEEVSVIKNDININEPKFLSRFAKAELQRIEEEKEHSEGSSVHHIDLKINKLGKVPVSDIESNTTIMTPCIDMLTSSAVARSIDGSTKRAPSETSTVGEKFKIKKINGRDTMIMADSQRRRQMVPRIQPRINRTLQLRQQHVQATQKQQKTHPGRFLRSNDINTRTRLIVA